MLTLPHMSPVPLGVIPVLIGPLQVLIAVLPAILVAVFSALVSLFKPRVMLHILKLLWRFKIQLALIVAAVVGLRWAAARFLPRGSRRASSQGGEQGLSETAWPVFRGGYTRSGCVGETQGPAAGEVNWRVADGDTFYASAAVVGRTLFAVSVSGLSVFDKEGDSTVYALDVETGDLQWSARPRFKDGASRYRGTFSSPVVKDTYLVCGEGLHETKRCRVVCLDLTPGREGNLLWSHAADGHVECTPVIAPVRLPDGTEEDRVFVGAGDTDGYYAFDLKTGTVRWHVPSEKYPDAETCLAVFENRVYAGIGNGKALCVLDAVDGREQARVPVPYPLYAPPALADGKLYLGMGNGDYVYAARDLGLPQEGAVWCVDLQKLQAYDPETFAPDWTLRTGDTILGSLALAGDTVYFCTASGDVVAADRLDGSVRAQWSAREAIKASPAVSPDAVYVVTETGMLYALDRDTLEPVWEYKVGTEKLCISSPVIVDGRAFVGTAGGGFVSVGRPAPKREPVWSGPLGGPGKGGNLFGSPPPERGVFHWTYPSELEGDDSLTVVEAPVAVLGGRLFLPLAAAAPGAPGPGLACFSAAAADNDGPGPPLWYVATTNGVRLSPAAAGDAVYVVDGRRGDAGRALHGLDAATGAPRWRYPVDPDAGGDCCTVQGRVLVNAAPRSIVCLSADGGTEQWRRDLAGRPVGPPTVEAACVFVSTHDGADGLAALDLDTGRPLWAAALAATPVTAPVRADRGTLYVGTTRGVAACDIATGQTLPAAQWPAADAGAVSGELVVTPSLLAYVSGGGDLVLVDRRASPPALRRVPGAMPGTTPLAGGNRVLYVGADGGMLRLDAPGDAGAQAWLADTAALGKPGTPAVLSGSKLYMGWKGWGLVCMGGMSHE